MAKKKAKKINYAKGWETRRRNAAMKARAARAIVGATALENKHLMKSATLGQFAETEPDSAGHQPPSDLDIKARAMMIAARKKGGEQAIKDALDRYARQAAYEARDGLHKIYGETLDERDQQEAIALIGGFMASVEVISKLNGGRLPPAVVITGISAVRVYDALKKVGYSNEGLPRPVTGYKPVTNGDNSKT